MQVPAHERILCDTSYLGHFERSMRNADRYRHWPTAILDRLTNAFLAITPFTLGEMRAGYMIGGWGPARVAHAENLLRSYILVPLDWCYPHLPRSAVARPKLDVRTSPPLTRWAQTGHRRS